MDNPFTLVFGKNPITSINRPVQTDEIVNNFQSENINQQIYIITGIRGYGKTVLMTEVANKLSETKDWIHVELNTNADLLNSLLVKLNSNKACLDILKNAKLNLSFFGFSVSFQGATEIKDEETAISEILLQMKKHNKRLLITIDEAINSEQMRIFTSAFQIFVRKDLPVFLLMTGLYKNINDLQNEKSLTFLYRAPKIHLTPLNLQAMALKYREIFSLGDAQAKEMADTTRGYPFAFQVLGYLTYENGGNYKHVLDKYELYLAEYVYEKVFSELSPKDREVVRGIAKAGEGQTKIIRQELNMTQNEFNPYRKRLLRKGIIYSDVRGSVRFTLPLFDKFCLEN